MKSKNLIRTLLVLSVLGLPMVVASVPKSSEITNDTAIYQNLHELSVKKIKNVNFDSDIKTLSAQEKSYHESLPTSVTSPMHRLEKSPYKFQKRKQL